MQGELPVLRVAGGLRGALDPAVLRGLDGGALARFLSSRRWFGGKGRAPAGVRVGAVVPVPWGEYGAALTTLEVDAGGGRGARYQLPLTVRPDEGGDAPAGAAVARIESDSGRGVLHDAVEDPAFRRDMVRAFAAGGAAFEADGIRWSIEPIGESVPLPEDAPSRVSSAEQSNTSIIFGDQAILKLFRRIEPGENPDVEIGRFLTTRTSFTHTPSLYGAMHLREPGAESVSGMLQRFVPGSGDAWAYALEVGRRYFGAPSTAEPRNEFRGDAERLGRITRELHDALASGPDEPAFAPRAATVEDVERWAEQAGEQVEDALALLEERLSARGVTGERAAEAAALLRRREEFADRLDRIVEGVGSAPGERIRHHGDYHLGQVLRAADGDFLVIDFEGEPARALEERREKHSALRDVAGMLRSFAYAAATLASAQRSTLPVSVLELRAARWEREARDAFLRGYLDGPRAHFLPAEAHGTRLLLELFEMEKVFYELAYELNNRPDWIWIPMRGIARLLTAPPGDA